VMMVVEVVVAIMLPLLLAATATSITYPPHYWSL